MSLKTRIRGFTAWVNLRLKPYGHLMNNVLMDLLTGTNMKVLLHSITGRQVKRLDTFEGLTQQQKITRVEWIIEELKKSKVIPDDVYVDTRLFAMRSADHVFQLLWRLVCHDIWFLWDRAEYLQHENDEIITEVPFTWIPEPPPSKKKAKTKTKTSLLSGFGVSAVITERVEENDEEMENYEPFPRSDFMKKFKQDSRKDGKRPSPDACIIDLLNKQLKTVAEGRKLHITSIDDLSDSRVLCALLNTFIPNLFTTEVFLNDRWTINTVIRTMEKMFYIDTLTDSEDFTEGDPMALSAYMCNFFMIAFKYRQSKAVVNRVVHLKNVTKEKQAELDKLVSNLSCSEEEKHHKVALKKDLENIKKSLDKIERRFDIDFCFKWAEHVEEISRQTHKAIRQKIHLKFDYFVVPRNITINDLCLAAGVNLTLTNGSGFYLMDVRESISENKRIVLRNVHTGEFMDDFTSKRKGPTIRQILRIPQKYAGEVIAKKFPQYEIYIESLSRNKTMHTDSVFLYQVFPSTMTTWQKSFMRAVKENEFDAIHRMVVFFRTMPTFINGTEAFTGDTALHWACRLGFYNMVEYLLENSADIDLQNSMKQTPLMAAIEGKHYKIAHLLIEWGCDVHITGPKDRTAFELIRQDDIRESLISEYEHYSTFVPSVMDGNYELLENLLNDHVTKVKEFNNIRSRCINGSTLLHTAAYFGQIHIIQKLLGIGLDVNLLDYKGATALHRANDVQTMKVLMDNGASPSVEDFEGNTALHVKCYGEAGKESEVGCVEMLVQYGAKINLRNIRNLLPIHCCAMQGRVDIIELLLSLDEEKTIMADLKAEEGKKPPSIVHLALANDFIPCAQWLIDHGFEFKNGEQDLLVQRILSEQITLEDRSETVKFLLENGGNPNPVYPGGNTGMHYASSMSGDTSVLETLISFGADLDAVNQDGATPLFFACQCNNQYATSILLNHGANLRFKNHQGLTAFDFVVDYDEWVDCGFFSEEIKARLKAYSLKHTRDLIRAISKKVKLPGDSSMYSHPISRQGPRPNTIVVPHDGSTSLPMFPMIKHKTSVF